MKLIPSQIQVKLDYAGQLYPQIVSTCIGQLKSPSDRTLQDIGSLVGNVANNLRSALNYAVGDFAGIRLKAAMSATEFRDLRRSRGGLDFPWAMSRPEFDNKSLVKHVAKHFSKVHHFLEMVQPYHPGKEWLAFLMRISNIDKHQITVEVADRQIVAFAFSNRSEAGIQRASIFGDKVMVHRADGSSVVCRTPCFLETCQLFASIEGKWVLFFINVDNNKLGLTRFVEQACDGVRRLLSDFYSLF